MQEPHKDDEEQEQIKLENEIKKIKLSLEYGAEFHESQNSNLPPEIESKWLENILQFENAFGKGKRTDIYTLVGKPSWAPADEIDDSELSAELDRLYDVLAKGNISLQTICDVDERVLYRFITEEFFSKECDDFVIEGMRQCYIYEDFHPNHEYDIDRICRDFITIFMKSEPLYEPVYMHFANKMLFEGQQVNSIEVVKKMESFRSLFQSFDLLEYAVTSMDIRDTDANVTFSIKYSGLSEGNDTLEFSGTGGFSLIPEFDLWSITTIDIPGVSDSRR